MYQIVLATDVTYFTMSSMQNDQHFKDKHMFYSLMLTVKN